MFLQSILRQGVSAASKVYCLNYSENNSIIEKKIKTVNTNEVIVTLRHVRVARETSKESLPCFRGRLPPLGAATSPRPGDIPAVLVT